MSRFPRAPGPLRLGRHVRCSALSLATAVALAAALPARARAQDPPSPFRPNVIHPYANVWRFTITFPDGHKVVQGLWSDLVDTMTVNGRLTVRRAQGAVYVNGVTQSTVNRFDAETMRPIGSVRYQAHGRPAILRTFEPGAVITRHLGNDGKPTDSTRTPLPDPVWDYSGGTYGILLAALPLHEGYTVSFPSIDETDDSVSTITARVVGREKAYAGNGRMLDAWKVEEGALTYWIADVPPYVLRLEFERPGGGVATWAIPY
jgi:hypothetical protein